MRVFVTQSLLFMTVGEEADFIEKVSDKSCKGGFY